MGADLGKEDMDYMYNFIDEMIKEVGPRMPCSAAEAEAAERIKAEFEGTCDETHLEKFTCRPLAAMNAFRLMFLLVIIAFGVYFLIPVIAGTYVGQILMSSTVVGLLLGAVVIFWKEVVRMEEFIDPLFKEKESQNVVGSFKKGEKISKVLIFSAHYDSAPQNNLLRYLRIGYAVAILFGFVTLFVFLVYSILTLIFVVGQFGYLWFYPQMWVFFAIGIGPCVCMLFFVSGGEKGNKVPGAFDNLSGTAIMMGLGRYLKAHREIIPEDTEVRLIAMGSEEALLRGSRRYVAKHLEELQKLDVEVVNLDSFHSPDHFNIITKEGTSGSNHSPEVIQKLVAVANSLGIKIYEFPSGVIQNVYNIIMGGSDATSFTQANIKAATLWAVDFLKVVSYYHTEFDTIEKVEPQVLLDGLKICIGYCKKG